MIAYYNEFDQHAATWLRGLMLDSLITTGDVDERSIKLVRGRDVTGYDRCHFFAGIAGWELALALAGWPADRPVWTGSCPCQPYSSAGKGEGEGDPRNLWPDFYRLIRECRPECVFGEQVASAIGHGWLDGVCADLEREGYAVGAAVLTAAGVGAPHIRQRLFWVAYTGDAAGQRDTGGLFAAQAGERGAGEFDGHLPVGPEHGGATRRLADVRGQRRDGRAGEQGGGREEAERGEAGCDARDGGDSDGLGDAGRGSRRVREGVPREAGQDADSPSRQGDGDAADDSSAAGFWDAFDLLPCRDDKVRRSQPGLLPVVDGVPFLLADGSAREGVSRARLLCGISNAIVPQVAALFIRAFLEATGVPSCVTRAT